MDKGVLPFDVVFADTCIGGSTVAARLARTRKGVRAFFLADYAVNPLGTRPREGIRSALNRWVDIAHGRSSTLVVACNTASVLLRSEPGVLDRASALGIRVFSMMDFLEGMLSTEAPAVRGKSVCLMGTEFTVKQPVYGRCLKEAGAGSLLPLPATRTERAIAHLLHDTREGRSEIVEEIRESVQASEAIVLACTCFPLVSDLVRELNPDIALLDPANGVLKLDGLAEREGPNRLTVGLTGAALSPDVVQERAESLFPGWELEAVLPM